MHKGKQYNKRVRNLAKLRSELRTNQAQSKERDKTHTHVA